MHNEEKMAMHDKDRRKIAKNTTSGMKHGHNRENPSHGDMGFHKGPDAINHTPYARYQDSIQGRNRKIEDRNLRNLKQD